MGTLNGERVIVFVAKEGPYQGRVLSAFNRTPYNMKHYLDDAHHTIKTGIYVPELNGFVKLIRGQGSAKYAFTGLDRATGNLTTFHIKTVSELAKKAPSAHLDISD